MSSTSWTTIALTASLFTPGTHAVEFYPRSVLTGCTIDFDVVTLTP